MTISVQHLSNLAYGFPRGKPRRVKPVALACIHITGNSSTASMSDLHKAAQAERDYANRAGSNGPSAHVYVARDGWAIEAVGSGYAAWSNGDVSSPHLANPGVAKAVAFRARGYNVNEAYWLEFECVGFGSAHPVTNEQKQLVASRIAAAAKSSGLPITRATVHGHWEINGVNRQNCPCAPAQHEPFLLDVIRRANLILNPAPPVVIPPVAPPGQETVMQSFVVPPVDTLAAVKAGAWLYTSSDLSPAAGNVQVTPGRAMPLLGTVGTTYIVEYVNSTGSRMGKAYWVKITDVAGTSPAPVAPPDCSAAIAADRQKARIVYP